MKIALIAPPIEDFYETCLRLIPLGLMSLKSILKRELEGVEIRIFDYHHTGTKKSIKIPEQFAFLKGYYKFQDKGPFSTFYHYYHFGASYDDIALEMKDFCPDLVGISSMFSAYYKEVIETARSIKKVLDVPIVIGGSHASSYPDCMLESTVIDYVIRGEGERPIVELVEYFLGKRNLREVSNIVYYTKEDGRQKAIRKENKREENFLFKDLPFPDYSGIKMDHYLYEGKPMSFLESSRSCPYDCSFCSIHEVFGKEFKQRDVSSIIEEISHLYSLGIRVFDFEDDNLCFDREWFLALCKKLKENFSGLGLEFLAMNGLSWWHLNKEVLDAMKEAGFKNLNISLVSQNVNILKKYHRFSDTVQFEDIVDYAAKSLSMNVTSYIILGLLEEPIESQIETLRFLKRQKTFIGVSPFYKVKRLSSASDDPTKFRLTMMGMEESTRDDVYTLFICARIINFLKRRELGHRRSKDATGEEILEKLYSEKKLFGKNKLGFFEYTKFKVDLALKCLSD